MELLWPDQDPAPLAKRLSVLLATVRGVLDPHKSLPPDHYLPAKGGSIAVDLDHVELDVDRFLRLADAGAYADAEPLYTAELLPEDVYEDWSTPLRDEARLAYVAVARRLAAEADDADTALRLWQRILVQDPHDEGAHLALVRCLQAAGRHGEARRRYVAYAARMAELAIEPEVFPER
jgi:DNA-binding SARP family transcriptional activator